MGNINYITYDELMASIESDFATYSANGLINRGNYIKVVRRVNHDIGLKIFREKETIIHVVNYKADIPEDFLYLQMALGCGELKYYGTGSIFGTHTEEKELPATCLSPDKVCVSTNGCGKYWVAQQFKEKVITENRLVPIRLSAKSLKFCGENCVNTKWNKSEYEIDIANGELTASFREGDIYFNYLADMVDEEGNVIVLDHPMVTPYYEYAVKKSILENIMIDQNDDVERKWGMIKNELREARIAALNFTNTIEYTEIQDFYKANRQRFYNKYVTMFYGY